MGRMCQAGLLGPHSRSTRRRTVASRWRNQRITIIILGPNHGGPSGDGRVMMVVVNAQADAQREWTAPIEPGCVLGRTPEEPTSSRRSAPATTTHNRMGIVWIGGIPVAVPSRLWCRNGRKRKPPATQAGRPAGNRKHDAGHRNT